MFDDLLKASGLVIKIREKIIPNNPAKAKSNCGNKINFCNNDGPLRIEIKTSFSLDSENRPFGIIASSNFYAIVSP